MFSSEDKMKKSDGTDMNDVSDGDVFFSNAVFYYAAAKYVYGQVHGMGGVPDANTFVNHAGCFDAATYTTPCSFRWNHRCIC